MPKWRVWLDRREVAECIVVIEAESIERAQRAVEAQPVELLDALARSQGAMWRTVRVERKALVTGPAEPEVVDTADAARTVAFIRESIEANLAVLEAMRQEPGQ